MDPRQYTPLEVLVIHELLVAQFGGMRGVTEQGFGKLEAALAAPYLTMFGEELYPDLARQAAVLFFRLARAHAFSDGNKRVALVALLDLLGENGMRIAADHDELYAFVIAAADDTSQDEAMAWVAARMIPWRPI